MNLTLHLTENCNMDCTYCIREKCPKDMTEDVLLAACDLAFSKGKRAAKKSPKRPVSDSTAK